MDYTSVVEARKNLAKTMKELAELNEIIVDLYNVNDKTGNFETTVIVRYDLNCMIEENKKTIERILNSLDGVKRRRWDCFVRYREKLMTYDAVVDKSKLSEFDRFHLDHDVIDLVTNEKDFAIS